MLAITSLNPLTYRIEIKHQSPRIAAVREDGTRTNSLIINVEYVLPNGVAKTPDVR